MHDPAAPRPLLYGWPVRAIHRSTVCRATVIPCRLIWSPRNVNPRANFQVVTSPSPSRLRLDFCPPSPRQAVTK